MENDGAGSHSFMEGGGSALLRLGNYTTLILLSVIWGLAFAAIRLSERYLSPVNLALARWIIASACFLLLAPFFGRLRTKLDTRDLPRFLIVAFANVVAYHLTLYYSEENIAAGVAGLLVALGPVFIMLMSRILLDERHGRSVAAALLLAFTGTLILSQGSVKSGGLVSLAGVLEAVGTAFSYALFAVLSKPLVQRYGARPITIWAGLAGTLMLLPLMSGSFFRQMERLPLQSWLALLYLAILSTVAGYMLFYSLVGRGSVTRLSIQLYLIPVVGVAGGVLLLGEGVTPYTIAGGVLLLSSVALATMRRRSRN